MQQEQRMADPRLEHLLRRAGFGASAGDLAYHNTRSYSAAVEGLLNYETIPDDVDTHIGQSGYASTVSVVRNGPFLPNTIIDDARQRWLFRMLHTNRPLQEKMALFWHNYFATAYTKLAGAIQAPNATRLMAAKPSEDPAQQKGQLELFRERALGSFEDLLVAVAQDPAMLIWLDGNTNTRARPQENFGRELMELFTRGVGTFTEDDVYAAARVFTGWNLQGDARVINGPFRFIYNANAHEPTAKSFSFPIYGNGGRTIPARAGSDGMQDGLDLIAALARHPETARRLAGKLYEFFVSETTPPPASFIDRLAAVYLQSDTRMAPVLRYLLNSAEFQAPSAYFARYSWPVEFVVKSLKETGWIGFGLNTTLTPLLSMGQQLFEPPDVAGWSLGRAWFSTGAMLTRMNFASALAFDQRVRLASAAAEAGEAESPQALVDYLLGRMTAADMSGAVRNDLLAYAGAGAAWASAGAQLQAKTSGVAHLILGSAEYQFL
jgi:uncharacterized protein (DUF1800 family)